MGKTKATTEGHDDGRKQETVLAEARLYATVWLYRSLAGNISQIRRTTFPSIWMAS